MSKGKDYVVFNENVYYLTDIEDYPNLEVGKYIAAEGVVDDKPVVSNLPSIKPFEVCKDLLVIMCGQNYS